MKDALDEVLDDGFGFRPVDRDGNSTHAKNPGWRPAVAGLLTAG
jgi:hypothetical protein